MVIRGCLFGIAVWILATVLLGVLLYWPSVVVLLLLFLIIFGMVLIYRIGKGHTMRCSALGALAAPFRLVDLI
jgi:hypothetical protein